MLRKDYIFIGIVNNSEKVENQYQFIYRKTLKYNSTISYDIISHKGLLLSDDLEKYVKLNNDKVLFSVMKTYHSSNEKFKKVKDNYLIFKKLGENEIYDYLITEVVKDKYTDFNDYLQNISKKMNLFQNDDYVKFNLTCSVNTDNSLFLVFCERMEKEETPFENREYNNNNHHHND